MQWYVYILECADGTLYTGITNQLEARLLSHEAGRGARYTRGRGPFRLAYRETVADRGQASRREAVIKKMTRPEKLALLKTTG